MLPRPRLALFLIDRNRSREVLVRELGESFAGTLVSDFHAAYNGLNCAKQRCLIHLLRGGRLPLPLAATLDTS